MSDSPYVDLSEVLIEVDRWTGFSQCLEHAAGSEPRSKDLQRRLYAALLSQGCNIGLTRMARSADTSFHQLAWCNTWYLREETLRHGLPAATGVPGGPCHVHHANAHTIGPDGSLYACPGFTGEPTLSVGPRFEMS